MEIRDSSGLTEREFMEQYQPGDYEMPSVAADMVIFTVTNTEEDNYRKLPDKELRILLIRRAGHPFLGKWALPGGFVRSDETTEQAAARELQEETGVKDVYLEQLYTFSDTGRDPRTWVMSCSYMALINSGQVQLKAGDDAADAAWFKVTYRMLRERNEKVGDEYFKKQEYELKLSSGDEQITAAVERTVPMNAAATGASYAIKFNEGLAFDHAKIIAYAIERLRGKVNYTGIAMNLLPERFTLTELQQVYEVILDKELLKAAFRRKVSDLVVETDEYTEKAGHRPSRLYRKNWEEI